MSTTNTNRTTTESTNLGMGLLIAESEDGSYQPIAPVATINEARELAAADMTRRRRELERGSEPMCAARYVVWGQGADGGYMPVGDIEAA